MRNSFLLKVVFLIALAVGLGLIVLVMRNFPTEATPATVQSQTFFDQFVIAGGPVVWFVLLPMSLVTVFLAIEHSLSIRRGKVLPSGIAAEIIGIIHKLGPAKLPAQIGSRNDFVSTAVAKAITDSRGDWFRMRSVLTESLQEQASSLIRRIEWLSLIGNVSPMVGLFGTVYGMIKLFNAIVISGGQPQPAQLAGGISVALVTTFWGLFIAIPALAIHGVFRNRIETLVSEAVVEALKSMAKPIKSQEEVIQVATISSENEEFGKIIADAIEKVYANRDKLNSI